MLSVIKLNVIMLSVVMLSVVMLSVAMPNVIMLNVIMPNVVMLSVIRLNVVAPVRQRVEGDVKKDFSKKDFFRDRRSFNIFLSPENSIKFTSFRARVN